MIDLTVVVQSNVTYIYVSLDLNEIQITRPWNSKSRYDSFSQN